MRARDVEAMRAEMAVLERDLRRAGEFIDRNAERYPVLASWKALIRNECRALASRLDERLDDLDAGDRAWDAYSSGDGKGMKP